MRRRGWSDPRAATNVAIGLAIAIERVHADGRVHGDISADSVGLRQDGGVILHAPASPATGAPEITSTAPDDDAPDGAPTAIASDNPFDDDVPFDDDADQPTAAIDLPGPASPVMREDDCYAVGALYYTMLTGTSDTATDEEGHRAALARRSDVPEEVAAVAARAVHPNPAERYRSAEHLHADLDAARASFPTRVPRPARPHSSGAPRGRTILIGLAILAVVAAGLWYFLLRGDSVTVPNVVGQTAQQAEQTIRDAGLEPRTEREWSASVATGFVIRTDPEGGASQDRGGTVTIVVSGLDADGTPSEVFVPDVVGRPEAEALQALEGAGLVPSVARTTDAQPEGTVIRLDPSPSSRVATGSSVTVTVSSGPSGATTSTEATTPGPETSTSEMTDPPSTDVAPDADAAPDGEDSSPPFVDDPPSPSGGDGTRR